MKRFTAISLAILILTISFRVSVAFHYCGGQLAQTKLVVGHGMASCGMEGNDKDCENKSATNLHRAPCCENELSQITVDDYKVPFSIVSSHIDLPVISLPFEFIATGYTYSANGFYLYQPPPDNSSVSLVVISSFLI